MLKDLPKEIIASANKCGLNTGQMLDAKTPKLFVEANKIIAVKEAPGLEVRSKETKKGVDINLLVKKRAKIKVPLHLCFGLTKEKGEQIINAKFTIEDGAEISIIAHCSFFKAKKVSHRMNAQIKIGKNAKLTYEEHHYHGQYAGALVLANFEVENKGVFETSFTLARGTVGKLTINTNIFGYKNSLTNLVTKVFGRTKKDDTKVYHHLNLKGEDAKGLTKMRAVAGGGSHVFMEGLTLASARGARGHIDCQEIVVGRNSWAKAAPIVEVTNDEARVTHEASVGKVDQFQLEALMAKGLSEEEALDMIIKGLF